MRILLDECLPKRLKRDLTGHDSRTVPEAGWAGKQNGDLLALAQGEFDVFLTVVVLVASSNRLSELQKLIPEVRSVLEAIAPGQLVRVGG